MAEAEAEGGSQRVLWKVSWETSREAGPAAAGGESRLKFERG